MTTYAVFPSGVAECARCGCDVTEATVGAFKLLRGLAPNAGVYLTFCQRCAEAIDAEREAAARPDAASMMLRRCGIGAHPRRHPAYGKSLAENPPPADEPLNIALGWPSAKNLPAPLLVVQPEDNPARLRFDVADGRRVRVAHPSNADPDRLLKLAQALIDHGATCVNLMVHPPRPGATERERLRVLVESDA